MTAILIKNGEKITVNLPSAEHEYNLHLQNAVEAYVINGIDYVNTHSKK